MFSQTKIVNRVVLGYALLLLVALTLGLVAARNAAELSQMTADILDHPFTVARSILTVKADVLDAQRLTGILVTSGNAAEQDALQHRLQKVAADIEANMDLVRARYLGDPREVAAVRAALDAWTSAREKTVELARAGRSGDAQAQNGERDAALAEQLLAEVTHVADFAAQRADRYKSESEAQSRSAMHQILWALLAMVVASVVVALLVARSIRRTLRQAAATVQDLVRGSDEKLRIAQAVAAGDLSQEIVVAAPLQVDREALPKDEVGTLIRAALQLSEVQRTLDAALQQMLESLRAARAAERNRDWLKNCRNDLNIILREEQDSAEVARHCLAYVVEALGGGVGAVYLFDEMAARLKLTATYGLGGGELPLEELRLGEGLLGEAVRQLKLLSLNEVPPGHLAIGSGLGSSPPKVLLGVPLLRGNRLIGAMEIGLLAGLSDIQTTFLNAARENIGAGLDAIIAHGRMAALLEETQSQSEELRVQQEELQQSNEELEERAQLLEQQREKIRIKSQQAEAAGEELRHTVEQLQRTSTYKSEFLANMSHELRTPLNSLMILSSLLMQNKDGNLSAKQVDFAATIHGAGRDLLDLINDILDLAKVESGHLQLTYSELPLRQLGDALLSLFQPLADKGEIAFVVRLDAALPPLYRCDEQRLHQILKNLLANAFKFTREGEVSLSVAPAAADNPLAVPAVSFVVRDSGIGIAADKLDLIFQAFHQADGSVSRKYGGTGLGLSISLELARKMAGEIVVASEEGKGSTFSLYLPLAPQEEAAQEVLPQAVLPQQHVAQEAPRRRAPPPPPPAEALEQELSASPLPDDRQQLKAGDKAILIIEDDLAFAKILVAMVRERGFAALVAGEGGSGIALAERFLPSAIVLDVMLPNIDGWGVMRSLKDNAQTRHIPVHFITCLEDRQRALAMGAIGFATKPASVERLDEVFTAIEGAIAKSVKRLLIVEDDADEAKSMVALLEEKDVDISLAASGAEALAALRRESFDCLVLDLGLADMSGFELLEHIQEMEAARRVPVIIHSGRDLSQQDERRLRHFAESIIIKGAKSPERLLNEVTLFLHLVESNLHPNKQRMIRTSLDKESMLEGRKVLLVDDDMRNIFSLSSALAEKSMEVIEAENGREALLRLEQHPDICLVLMDIMMPEMDGYAAMRALRQDARWRKLPVIAMTAKALKGDHEKCIAAGASDYIAKPIDVDKLLSLIRVWLFQGAQ